MGREFTGESAFVDAYSEYFDAVYREALKYSGNHHVAEEIAQDAFFTAFVFMCVSTFLTKVAKNICLRIPWLNSKRNSCTLFVRYSEKVLS